MNCDLGNPTGQIRRDWKSFYLLTFSRFKTSFRFGRSMPGWLDIDSKTLGGHTNKKAKVNRNMGTESRR
jgi:hypothetical protein